MNAQAHQPPCLICRLPLLTVIAVLIGGGVAAYRLYAAEKSIEQHDAKISAFERNVAVLPGMQQDLAIIKQMLMEKR